MNNSVMEDNGKNEERCVALLDAVRAYLDKHPTLKYDAYISSTLYCHAFDRMREERWLPPRRRIRL